MFKYNLPILVETAIEMNKESRDRFKGKDSLSHLQYAKEFCTVHVDVGRQTGKTTFAWVAAGADAIVIAHSVSGAKYCQSDKVVSFHDIPEDISMIDTVYIDEPSLNKHLDAVYLKFTKDENDRTFVLLGR